MPYLTKADVENYGTDTIDFARRAAADVVAPAVRDLAQRNEYLAQQLRRVQTNDIWNALLAAIPNAREINQSEAWKDWLRYPDIYSGEVKQTLLDRNLAAGNAGPIISMMQGFLAERGQQTRSARSPAQRASRDQTIILRAAIQQFYSDLARNPGRYTDAQKREIEAALHSAVTEGRVR